MPSAGSFSGGMPQTDAAISTGIERLARAGYAARGAVYLIIGFFTVLAALGGSEAKDSEDALAAVLGAPFGTILVWAMVIGLFGHAGWRAIQAVKDPDRHGKGAKGIAVRAGLLGSGVVNFALAMFALGLVSRWGSSGGDNGDPTGGWIAAVFDAGLGWLVVWAVAAILLAVAGAHFWKAATAGFEKHMRCPPDVGRWVRPLSQAGLFARGAVFLILAILIVTGGFAYSPENQPGLKDALAALQGLAFGWAILLAMGIGFLAFAVYSFAQARYRRIDPG